MVKGLSRQTKVRTKNVGSSGGQIRCGQFESIDAQSMNGYLGNVRISALLNDSPEGEIGGFIAYLTTNSTWDEDDVICARAGRFADTVNLSAKRWIKQDGTASQRNDGIIHLWVEITDITVTTDVELRLVTEAWGKFLTYTAV